MLAPDAMATALLLTLVALLPNRGGSWDFGGDEPGKLPRGYYTDETGNAPPGRWEVIDDAGNRALAQLDRARDRRRLALAVVDDSSVRDVRLSVRVKVLAGDVERAGGIVWRYRNSENYLVARLDTREDNVCLYRVVGGNRVRFGREGDLKLEVGRRYTLRVDHRGREIKVYLDGDFLFDEDDRHFRRAGKVGLWAEADSHVLFDDLKVTDLDDDDD